MDPNEAYNSIKQLITTDKKTLGLRTAKDMEQQAIEDPEDPLGWIWAAGAYALEGNKSKFSETLLNAASRYAKEGAYSLNNNEFSDMYKNEANAVRTLAENTDKAYEIVITNLPKGASNLELVEAARMLFTKSIIENEILVKGGIDAVLQCAKNANIIQDREYKVRLIASPLLFYAYDLTSTEGKEGFENAVNITKKISGKPNLETFLAEGIEKQVGNNIGWYLTKI